MSRLQRTLTLHTSLGPAINYTLQATVPPHLLTKCSAALPRPTWEPLLYYSIVCIMGFFLFCIFAASYFEAERIYTSERIRARLRANALLESSQGTGSNSAGINSSKVFDLNNLTNDQQHHKVVANGTHHRLPNGTVGGGATKSSSVHTAERYVETLTASTSSSSRPSSGGRRRKDNNNTQSPSIVSYIYKAIGYPWRFSLPSFKLNLFKPTAKSSPPNGGGAKSEKESKSSSVKNSAISSDTKADPHASVTATQTTILRRSSSNDRDVIDDNINARSNTRNKNNKAAAAAKRQFPDVIPDQDLPVKNNKNKNHDLITNKTKAADRNNKRNERYSSSGIEPIELRSNNSTPEIDEDDQPFNKG